MNLKFHKVVQTHYLGEVETFIILCGKYFQDNKYTILSESAYGFVDDVTKTVGVFFGLQFQLLFTCKTRINAKFHKVQCSNNIHASWKTFKLLYRKFIQDNVRVRRVPNFIRIDQVLYYDKTFGMFFSVHSVTTTTTTTAK